MTSPQPAHPRAAGVPQANSDNPFLRVDPGTSFDYLYQIPPEHPAGTYWYHPHHHGTVADQIFGGLAGALLVDPPLGQGPDLSTVEDRVLLITDTTLDSDARVVEVGAMDRAMGRQGELVLVNGQHQPIIPAAPGATQRWRIINGCVARVLALRLQEHPFVQVAHDGTFLPGPVPRDRGRRTAHPPSAGRECRRDWSRCTGTRHRHGRPRRPSPRS